MAIAPANNACTDFVQSIRSDQLPQLAGTLKRMMPYLDQIGMFQLDVILDANVVISELLWMATKRINPTARSGLMEIMDCKVVRAFAPYYLRREMKVKIPEVAEKQGIAPAVLHMLWLEFLPKIRFVAVGGPPKNGNWRDPKDVPYLRLQRKLQYPIVSADPHLPAMGARVIHVQMLNPLRGYSRAAAIEYQLKFSGALSGSLLAAFTQSMASAVRRIPTPVLIGMAILGALALAQPNSRKRIFEIGTDLLAGAAIAGGALIEAINPMLEAHAAAQREAQLQLSTVKATLASANHLAPHRADISSAGG